MRKKDKFMPAQLSRRNTKEKSAQAEAKSRLKRSYNSKGTEAGDETQERAVEQETKNSE